MRIYLLIAILATTPLVARSSLAEMKKDLHHAEKELQIAYSKVLHLRETIALKEISRIEKELAYFEGSDEERLDFLDLTRKNLSSIMNEVPSCITEAQHVLDTILVAITELKEEMIITQNAEQQNVQRRPA